MKAGAERAEEVAEDAADKGFFLWKVRSGCKYLCFAAVLRELEIVCLALRLRACRWPAWH